MHIAHSASTATLPWNYQLLAQALLQPNSGFVIKRAQLTLVHSGECCLIFDQHHHQGSSEWTRKPQQASECVFPNWFPSSGLKLKHFPFFFLVCVVIFGLEECQFWSWPSWLAGSPYWEYHPKMIGVIRHLYKSEIRMGIASNHAFWVAPMSLVDSIRI